MKVAGHQFNKLNAVEIRNILPHRYPFLFVDRIEEVKTAASSPVGDRIIGFKGVTQNEAFFQGHFPTNPVMPGVLILEALAQVGALLMYRYIPGSVDDYAVYLSSVADAKFRKPILPGSLLRLEAEIKKVTMKKFWTLNVQAFLENGANSELVAEAQLSSAVISKEIQKL